MHYKYPIKKATYLLQKKMSKVLRGHLDGEFRKWDSDFEFFLSVSHESKPNL